MKKFLSIALALVMTVALAVPAFATTTETVPVKIQKLPYAQTYYAYKLADLVSESEGKYAYDISDKYIDMLITIIKAADAEFGTELEGLQAEGTASAAKLNQKIVSFLGTLDTSGDVIDKTDIDGGYFGTADAKAFSESFAQLSENEAEDYLFTVDATENFDNDAPEMQTMDTQIAPGYYVFIQILDTAIEAGNVSKSLYIMNTASISNGELAIYPKSGKGTPTIDKTVNGGDMDYVSGGDTVDYAIDVQLPNTFWEYKRYLFALHDKAEHQEIDLTSVKVEVFDVLENSWLDITEPFAIEGPITGETADPVCAGHDLHVGTTNLLDILVAALPQVPAPESLEDAYATPAYKQGVEHFSVAPQLKVTYKATLIGNDAVMGDEGNKNTVHGEFSNEPYSDCEGNNDPFNPDIPTGTTPGDTTILITYQTDVNKVDQENKPLKGAEFTLYRYVDNMPETSSQSEPVPVEVSYEWVAVDSFSVFDADTTTFSFKAVGPGYYKLEETKAPSGFNAIDPIYFEIALSGTADEVTGIIPVAYQALKTPEEIEVNESNDAYILTGTRLEFTPYGEQETPSAIFNLKVEHAGADTTIQNMPGALLPSTGGMGTTILYIGGAVALIAVAGAIIILKRKKAASAE